MSLQGRSIWHGRPDGPGRARPTPVCGPCGLVRLALCPPPPGRVRRCCGHARLRPWPPDPTPVCGLPKGEGEVRPAEAEERGLGERWCGCGRAGLTAARPRSRQAADRTRTPAARFVACPASVRRRVDPSLIRSLILVLVASPAGNCWRGSFLLFCCCAAPSPSPLPLLPFFFFTFQVYPTFTVSTCPAPIVLI